MGGAGTGTASEQLTRSGLTTTGWRALASRQLHSTSMKYGDLNLILGREHSQSSV